MSSAGAARCAAVPTSNARAPRATDLGGRSASQARASRKNGAKSRGPKTAEGKARSAQNALKHGLRAQKYVVLPEEDGAEFKALEAALLEELAPAGALQTVLARRVAVAAWRLMRADRMEVEVLDFRRGTPDNIGLALIRDGNGTRAVETLLRYRGAASAELMRALRMLKALQAEQAADTSPTLSARRKRPAALLPAAERPQPNQPDARPRPEYVLPEPGGRALHEPAVSWTPCAPRPDQTNLRPTSLSRSDLPPEQRPGPARVRTIASDPASAAAVRARPSKPEAGASSGEPTLPDDRTNPSATPPASRV